MPERSIIGNVSDAHSHAKLEHYMFYLKARKQIVISVILLIVWLNVGALVYGQMYGWHYTAALYYSAQAGLSIGFGALSEATDGSRLYTIFHVLAGSSFIAGAVGLFATNLLEKNAVDWEEQYGNVMKKVIDSEDGSTLPGLSWWERNQSAIRIFGVGFIWLIVGVTYGLVYEDWTFIQCIYFAVAACSTAGLQAPSVDLSNNNFQLFYVTVFIIFGVPIYGMVLGQFANLTIEDYLEKKTQDKIHKRMTTAEINFAMHFDKSTGDVVEWPEFVCFSLIRLGICEKDILDEIRHHFEEMDIDSSGYLEKDELAAAMAFDRRDIKRNGALSKASFRLLFSDLIRTQYESTESDDEEDAENRGLFADITALRHLDAPDRVFADTNEDNDDTITRQEFQLFWNFATSEDGVQFFRDNAIPWLEGKVRLPLNSIKEKIVAAQGDSLQKQINIKNSECLHFLHWSRTSEGKEWLAANQDAFHNGLTPPPEAFLHQHVQELSADRPVIKVSSEPVSANEKHDEKQN